MDTNALPRWKLAVDDLMQLWLVDYPRLLGSLWHNDQHDRFRTDAIFCRSKLYQQCQFPAPATLPIEVMKGEQYEIRITPTRLFLPMPARPDSLESVFRNYLLQSRFFYLPGSRLEPAPERTASADVEESPPPPPPIRDAQIEWELSGSTLQKLIMGIPRLIAMDWLSPESPPFYKSPNLQQTLEKYLETSLDGFFSKGGRILFGEMTVYNASPFLSPEGLYYPIPDKPQNLNDVFQSFSEGTATNPSITYCPTHTATLTTG